jgi:hypothetical protein
MNEESEKIDPMDEHVANLSKLEGSASSQDEVRLNRFNAELLELRLIPNPSNEVLSRIEFVEREITILKSMK